MQNSGNKNLLVSRAGKGIRADFADGIGSEISGLKIFADRIGLDPSWKKVGSDRIELFSDNEWD